MTGIKNCFTNLNLFWILLWLNNWVNGIESLWEAWSCSSSQDIISKVWNLEVRKISPFLSSLSYVIPIKVPLPLLYDQCQYFLPSTSSPAYRSLSFWMHHQKHAGTILPYLHIILAALLVRIVLTIIIIFRQNYKWAVQLFIMSSLLGTLIFCSLTLSVSILPLISDTTFPIHPKVLTKSYFCILYYSTLNNYLIYTFLDSRRK
jgi:hypothetical protein